MADTITVLTHPTNLLAKTWHADGSVSAYDNAKHFKHKSLPLSDIEALSALLTRLQSSSRSCVIRGTYIGDEKAKEIDDDWKEKRVRRILQLYDDAPHHWMLVEVDSYIPIMHDPNTDPVGAITEYIETELPPAFMDVSYHWQLSNSAGHEKHFGKLKVHIWFWLARPYTSDQLRAWATASNVGLDKSVLNAVQPHYTAAPIFDAGIEDPIATRSGFVQGMFGDEVDLLIPDDVLESTVDNSGRLTRQQKLQQAAHTDPRAAMLYAKGMVKSVDKVGGLRIKCPRDNLHSGESGETSTLYYPAHTGGYEKGTYKCLHAHCAGVATSVFDTALGYDDSNDDFEVEPEGGDSTDQAGADPKPAKTKKLRIKKIPEAMHLCTDQANAGRIVANFKSKLMVCAEKWYTWGGTHWSQDESEVYRCALMLSKIINKEADAWAAANGVIEKDVIVEGKNATDIVDAGSAEGKATAKLSKHEKIVKAIRDWAKKSEMIGAINAALYIAKKMLSVPPSALNRNGWDLNCVNGTVDLRTGILRPHDPADMITMCVTECYVPDAQAPMWQEVLRKVTLEQGMAHTPIADFLKRWFGYCATDSTREQKFVVHYGNGSNGKSTILGTITSIMGAYSAAAPPGLLMSGQKERHPTEIADLMGRRMVTAYETGDSGILREDFIKQATGEDLMKARLCGKDFFEFLPTHKMQLLTNYKPTIKGQDNGIWRRVILVPYCACFGTEKEIEAGVANYLRDNTIAEKLKLEREGILTWVVQGAREWSEKGLAPPDSILAAGAEYQTEQDRIAQFVREVCEIGEAFSCYLTDEYGGLFVTYSEWCKEGGFFALSKNRFLGEIQRVVPKFRKVERFLRPDSGSRKRVLEIFGLKILE